MKLVWQTLALHLAAALLLAYIISNLSTTTVAAATEGCNATGISECLADDEEEFLMESETSRRILFGVRHKAGVGYGPLKEGNAACPGGACQMRRNNLYIKGRNTCEFIDKCRGAGGGA